MSILIILVTVFALLFIVPVIIFIYIATTIDASFAKKDDKWKQ